MKKANEKIKEYSLFYSLMHTDPFHNLKYVEVQLFLLRNQNL